MKIETKLAQHYSSLFFRVKIPFTKKIFRSHFLFYNMPNAWVMGYSNRCKDSRFVLFIDYDSMPKEDLENELKYLQKTYKLGTFYIFKLDRENSWHAICLDKLNMLDTYTILKDSSSDFAFTNSIKNLQTRAWVLRWGKKGNRNAPRYFNKIEGKTQREQSNAHAKFIEKIGAEINPNGKWDCYKEIQLVKYDTANRLEKE